MTLGIDPGYGRCGYAFIDKIKEKYKIIEAGLIETSSKDIYKDRLIKIYDTIETLIKKYMPNEAAIESIFFSKNTKTAIQVAEARGVIILCFAKNNLEYREYKPNEVKLGITGNGRADKDAVMKMVSLFTGEKIIQDDCADAVAIALSHASRIKAVNL